MGQATFKSMKTRIFFNLLESVFLLKLDKILTCPFCPVSYPVPSHMRHFRQSAWPVFPSLAPSSESFAPSAPWTVPWSPPFPLWSYPFSDHSLWSFQKCGTSEHWSAPAHKTILLKLRDHPFFFKNYTVAREHRKELESKSSWNFSVIPKYVMLPQLCNKRHYI